jgi:hypothetical protein
LESSAVLAPRPRRDLLPILLGLGAFALIAAAGLWWAKWSPYSKKLSGLLATPVWPGHDLLAKAGRAGSTPSASGAWAFTQAYIDEVWKGFLVALLVAAGVQTLVPRRWLLRALTARSRGRGSMAGGIASLPSLMCTCCTAPIAVSLRRDGVPTSAALAYWVGNPVLNPAVLAFLAIVAPWQWVATRIVIGLLLVFVATAIVARFADRQPRAIQSAEPAPVRGFNLRAAPADYLRTLARLAVTLIPIYVAVVFLLGLFRGWLFPLDAGAEHWVVLSVLGAAILGTLVVIPTAGEIPILQGLAGAGVSTGAIGALLITLPAISLASMAMVVRAFSPRVTLAMAGAVMACGLLAGLLLWLLSG